MKDQPFNPKYLQELTYFEIGQPYLRWPTASLHKERCPQKSGLG